MIACLFLFHQAVASTTQQAYRQILQGNLSPDLNHIATPHRQYLDLMASSLRYFILEDISSAAIDNLFEQHMDVIESTDPSHPYKLYYEADSRLRWAAILAKEGQRLDAAWQVRQAYKAIERNIELFPDYVPSYKTLGVLQVALGAVPEKYQWLISLAGMEGSIDGGLKHLDKVVRESQQYGKEALILKSLAYAYILEEPATALVLIGELNESTPIIQLLRLAVRGKASSNGLTLGYRPLQSDYPLITYLVAEAHFQAGRYGQASALYNQYLQHHAGNAYKTDSYYKLYLISYFQGHNSDSLLTLTHSATAPTTLADKNAIELSKRPLKTKELIMLRYAIDGGFYERADSVIGIYSGPTDEQVEFQYRQARLYQKRDEYPQAMALYKKVINTQTDNDYYAPNSALILGLHYTKLHTRDSAEKYLNMARDYRNHPYETSIEAKAEAALNRIKDLPDDAHH